ncbi:MAG: branched-chain amino acid ABC transporter permease [Desulfovermiculus sp.]|nr:branched-chain amino acid ABC transporter permease [Desulfovermiculus sp.]
MTRRKENYRKKRLDRGIKVRSDSIFLLTSYREIAYTLFPRVGPVACLLLIPFIFWAIGADYYIQVAILTFAVGLLALSWDFLASAGLFSLGQALFFGIGSYVSASFNYYLHFPPLVSMILATVVGAVIGTSLLVPVLRLRGIYFSMITLILPIILAKIIEATHILGGSQGLTGLPGLGAEWVKILLSVFVLVFVLFVFRRIIDTDYGLIIRSLKENDRVLISSGININWTKTQVIFISALVGSFSGAFMAHYYGIAGISQFALDMSILPLAATILGGSGSFAGAILGSAILVPISEALRFMGTLRIALFALVMVFCIAGLPEGLFHYLTRKYQQTEIWVRMEGKES